MQLWAILFGILIGLFLVWVIYRIGTAIERYRKKKYLDWLEKTHTGTIDTVNLNEAKKERIDELYKKLQDQLDEYSKQNQVPKDGNKDLKDIPNAIDNYGGTTF